MIQKICRLCQNTENWARPTKKKGENKNAYPAKHGFGFEEWLNREEWLLSGYPGLEGEWRYVHIQGMYTKKNHYEGEDARILFYVKEPGSEAQTVGILENAIVLDTKEATWAAKKFTEKGWLQLMHDEVKAIGGDTKGLPPVPQRPGILTWENPLFYANVRFRLGSLRFFDIRRPITPSSYYYTSALDWDGIIPEGMPPVQVPSADSIKGRRGIKELRRFSEEIRRRREAASKEFFPRQAPIQNALAVQLDDFFRPQKGIVTCEDERVDIKLVAPDKSISFIEIKPSSTARQAIRLSLGQLLEYSHYPDTAKAHRLIIVSDAKPQQEDMDYLDHINNLYGLPVRYVYWIPNSETLPQQTLQMFV